jgi:group I intron endonuclease
MNDAPKMPGVYCIEHRESGKKYVGSAHDMNTRVNAHLHALARKKHENSRLQAEYNKCGWSGFVVYVLEACQRDELPVCEAKWLADAKPFGDKGFNVQHNTQRASQSTQRPPPMRTLCICITESQRTELWDAVESEHTTLTEYVRRKLFGDGRFVGAQ